MAFVKQTMVEDVKAIGANDIQVTKFGNGFKLTASWSVKTPIFGNVSACMDFEAVGQSF